MSKQTKKAVWAVGHIVKSFFKVYCFVHIEFEEVLCDFDRPYFLIDSPLGTMRTKID